MNISFLYLILFKEKFSFKTTKFNIKQQIKWLEIVGLFLKLVKDYIESKWKNNIA